ncbi:hypothetical protein Acr_00g0093240 [Actinidia rufa]|uniref:Uncharacterized protein n=1 Tax=Actinidia rufa TaxID=165716 RepID=A0A7J0DZH3_9ERIC|nr:hypothetical protein Acr_00g0093240 [Actinidia rufa]
MFSNPDQTGRFDQLNHRPAEATIRSTPLTQGGAVHGGGEFGASGSGFGADGSEFGADGSGVRDREKGGVVHGNGEFSVDGGGFGASGGGR